MQKFFSYFGLGDLDHEDKSELSLDKLLDNKIEFGKAQKRSLASVIVFWIAEGSEMIVIGILMPQLQNEWNLTSSSINLMNTIIFFGIFLGALLGGKVADNIGRRQPLLFGCLILVICSFWSVFSSTYVDFILARFICGICMGMGSPIVPSYLSEILPTSWRARAFLLVAFGFTVGELLGLFCSYFLLNSFTNGAWRLVIFISSLPALLSLPLIYYNLYESPRYFLIITNQKKKAIDILEKMYYVNNVKGEGTMTPQQISDAKQQYKLNTKEKQQLERWADKRHIEQKNQTAKYKELFSQINKPTTLQLSVVWMSLSLIFYGITIILPTIIVEYQNQYGIQKEEKTEISSQNYGVEMAYYSLTILAEIPSIVFVYYFVENPQIGRKNIIQFGLLGCVGFLLLSFLMQNIGISFYFFLALARFCIMCVLNVMYPFTAEIYRTSLRVTGLSFGNSIARIGGMSITWISALGFYLFGVFGPMLMFAIFAAISTIAAFMIPVDTTNQQLDSYQELVNLSSNKITPSINNHANTPLIEAKQLYH
ncbi:Major facilitator superfamily domain, general substrate transporter [Pseudocohnilembus persalinus]|uniref:Major facilitator superfamily domain, general substrate transporter n=1 Tax=Pseudocohnilembus persalinus TaxID=266149 RepID=A0A0V0QUK9_PSEPJ|nr:Major facilitator superfamily domain, general substrate transporter [Pseudocohnilembus persalinus]|eukprot:KRX05640.1 Major facilitator superfamily domain, general substrate transporter [Pseudocohnilembus persalinus]